MDLLDKLPQGWAGIGALLGVLAGGVIFLRQFLSGAAATRASDEGQIAALDVYRQMVNELRSQLEAANTRADQFAKERNEAIAMLGKSEGQMAEMARQIERQSHEIRILREQVEGLKRGNV